MNVHAEVRDTGFPAQKALPVVTLVRGKKVDEALTLLRFVRTPIARTVAKVIKSASANAENNFQMTPSDLKIVAISADPGRNLKRYRPQARGRMSPILKRSCHITVTVAEEEK